MDRGGGRWQCCHIIAYEDSNKPSLFFFLFADTVLASLESAFRIFVSISMLATFERCSPTSLSAYIQ